jgi:hypothetical protein
VARQGQQDFLFHEVIQVDCLIDYPQVEILLAQFVLLILTPLDRGRKSLGKLYIDGKLYFLQTTPAGYRNPGVQIASNFELATLAACLPFDLDRLD